MKRTPQTHSTLSESISRRAFFSSMGAGITGLAQLRELQGDASMDALDLDMQYLATRTLWSDLGLIFATLFTIARAPFQTHGSSAPSRT